MTEATASVSQKRPASRSIAFYLVALALLSVVPSFVFAGVLIHRYQSTQQDTVEALIVSTSRSIIQAVDREISANITTLHVLAASPSLRSGDFRGFYDRSVLALQGSDANLFIVNPDFTSFASTRQPFDSPPTTTSDIPSAERAFANDRDVVTNLVFGAVSKRWVYNILLPVDLGQFGRKLIALNQQADNFASTLSIDSLPDGWNAALLDNEGKIIVASPDVGAVGDMFTQFNPMGQAYSTGWQYLDTINGRALGVIEQSGTTGWRLVTWAPAWSIIQPLMMALLALVAGAFVLLVLIIGALFWVSKRIGGSVRGLARDARLLGAGQLVTATPYPVSEIADISEALAQASRDRQAAEQEVNFLMREVAHRSKNQMTVIAAMAKQTARGAEDVVGYVQGFERRIMGLARSTDLLLAHGRVGVSLGELVESQVAPFSPEDPARVTIDGPEVRLNMHAAQIIGMAIHELSTNAVKYGAFLGTDGRLSVQWRRQDDSLSLVWRETVSHALPQSDRVGFGTTVLQTMVGRSLGATVERIGHADGIEWRFGIPLDAIDPVQQAADDAELAAQ